MKKILLTSLLIFLFTSAFSQGGQKWSASGNTTVASDFLGTNNNRALIFKTNGQQQMMLNSGGGLQVNNLAGNGKRLVFTDGFGNLIPFNLGLPGQYLDGSGSWINFPAIPPVLWMQNGSTIFYNGNVGINNPNPLFALDVNGDLSVSNNVYVGGTVLIGRQIRATTDMATPSLTADSINPTTIFMGPGRSIDGQTTINGDIIAQSKLTVQGNSIFSGNITVNGAATVGQLNISQSLNTPALITSRIKSSKVGADTAVHIGDSSITFFTYTNQTNPITGATGLSYDLLYSTISGNRIAIGGNNTVKALGFNAMAIGPSGAKAYGNNSMAIGPGAEADANFSMAIGRGAITTSSATSAMAIGYLVSNSKPNSLAIGFNSNLPTLFVGASTGNGTTGYVGIGTDNPQAPLEVTHVPSGSTLRIFTNGTGDITSSTSLSPHFGPLSTDNFSIFQGVPGSGKQRLFIAGGTGSTLIRTTDATTTGTSFKVVNDPVVTNQYGGNDIFVVSNDGVTTINTSSSNLSRSPFVITTSVPPFFGQNGSDNKLFEVTYRGAVYAREIFVSVNNFPDYVFSKEYKLTPLNEVENYLFKEKHLKNMPSAREVEKEGANLGEIQRVSVEKIEEIYLYMIEMNKKIEALQKENEDLKKRLKK